MPEAKYREIKREMILRLKTGVWLPAHAIPSEAKLKAEFAVAIGTIRRAVDELVAEHLLIRRQGSGTYVPTHNQDRHLFYFFRVARQDGFIEYPVIETLRFGRARANADAAARLKLRAGEAVIEFRNALRLQDVVVLIDDIVIPWRRFKGLTEAKLRERPNTIYNLYQDAFGVNVVRAAESVRASLASIEQAALFGVAVNAPLLDVHRVVYTYDDVPVEYRRSFVNTARHEYVNDLKKSI